MFTINRNNKNIPLIGLPEWDELGVPIKYNRYIKALFNIESNYIYYLPVPDGDWDLCAW